MIAIPDLPDLQDSESQPNYESPPADESEDKYNVGDYVVAYYKEKYRKGLIFKKNEPPEKRYLIYNLDIGDWLPVDKIAKLITREEFETEILNLPGKFLSTFDYEDIVEYNRILGELGKDPYIPTVEFLEKLRLLGIDVPTTDGRRKSHRPKSHRRKSRRRKSHRRKSHRRKSHRRKSHRRKSHRI